MDIRCRKTKCQYNDRYTCMADDILVDKKVECSTFINSDKNVPDTTKRLFERTPEYAPHRENKDFDVGCKAACVFNKEGTCIANGVTINSLKNSPFCVTYVKK